MTPFFELVAVVLKFFNAPPTPQFQDLICAYDLKSLSVEIPRKEFISGFKKLNKVSCVEDSKLTTIIFLSNSGTKVFKVGSRKMITSYLKKIPVGETIEVTLLFELPFLHRRNKMVTLVED